MRIVMNWTRGIRFFLLFTGVILLLQSWENKNFASFLFGGAIFSGLIASKFLNTQAITVPLTSIFVVLAAAEIAIPHVFLNSNKLTEVDSTATYISESYFERIEGFGYRPRPGVYTSRVLSRKGEEIYDVVYTIGNDGYRNDIQNTNYTAYIFGGSFTFGEGLNDNETLSYYLLRNHGISSKNVGIHGYGLHQALYNIGQGLVPQRENVINILVTAPWHALRSSCKELFSDGTPKYQITSTGLKLVGTCADRSIISKVLRKSNIFSLVKLVIQNENVITDADIDLYLEIIREISRLSEAKNSKVLVAYIDAKSELLENTKWSNESIISELSKFTAVLDVTLAETREELNPRFYIHELDQHPSAVANEHRAKIIASHLQN